MGYTFLMLAQVLAAGLFLASAGTAAPHWLAWATPIALIILSVANTFRFSRFVAWLIFALAFFSFLVVLSAFTLRWRLEGGFAAAPFYRAMIMYIAFVYISLAQIKLSNCRAASSGLAPSANGGRISQDATNGTAGPHTGAAKKF